MRTIEFERVKHVDACDKHTEQRILHYCAFAEVEGTEKGKEIFENCAFLRSHADYVDPRPDKLSCCGAYGWLTIAKPVANDLLALSDR
jgi:hypothetical protein